jgi:hypothetical protein
MFMAPFNHFARGLSLASVMAFATALAAQDPPLRTISKLDVEYAEPFSCVSGFRELADGRLIVADVKEKTVQLIDLRAGKATKIGQEGQGPGEWSTPMGLFALPGDTTLLLDPQNQRFLTILPNGSIGKSFTVDLGGGARGGLIAGRPQGIDRMGRLYYQGSAFVFNEGSPPTALDSAPIVRYDRGTAKVDTLLWLQLPKSNVQTSGGRGNVSITMTGANPLVPQRAWAVAPDGRIAIVHGDPYQVEWIGSSRARSLGPATPYPRRGITDADKEPVQNPDCSVTISLGGGGGDGAAARGATVRSVMTSVGGGRGAPPRTDWPEAMPPFATGRFGAVRAAPNGELWVPRSRGPNDAPTFDVFDGSGKLVSRVAMPKGTRLLGFGAGTVYAYRMDEDDLVYLQRYRLDAGR